MKLATPKDDQYDFLRDLIDEVCSPIEKGSKIKTLKEMTPKEKKTLCKQYKCKIKES